MSNLPTPTEAEENVKLTFATIAKLQFDLSIAVAQQQKTEELYSILADRHRVLFDTHQTLLKRLHEMSKP